MEQWQTELRLRFRGVPWKLRVGFCFEWKAWLIAYDHQQTSPGEFGKLDMERQISAIIYGAACWDRIKKKKKIFFSDKDLEGALMRASKADNLKLIAAMRYAQFPNWLQAGMPPGDDDKKKANSP